MPLVRTPCTNIACMSPLCSKPPRHGHPLQYPVRHCRTDHLIFRTPNGMAYVETGRFPLYVHFYTTYIKYRLRLTRMNISSLPRKAYNMLLWLHDSGKLCWVSQVHHVLYTFVFGFVWGKPRCANSRNFYQGV